MDASNLRLQSAVGCVSGDEGLSGGVPGQRRQRHEKRRWIVGRADIVRPYVEKILKQVFEIDELVVDERGEWPFRRGSAIYHVRLFDGNPPLLQVWSPLLTGLRNQPGC